MGLNCRNLIVTYPKTVLPTLHGLDLSIERGKVVGITGPSGAGKTTLLRCLAGTLSPTAGAVEADGAVALVEQQPERQLFAPTVFDEVAFGPRNLGLDESTVAERVNKALTAVGLNPEAVAGTSPFAHSGGERRRIAIADMLAMDAAYLLLDEPTAGLDPRERTRIERVLGDLAARGTGIVVVSHDQAFLRNVCDRVVELQPTAAPSDGSARTVGSYCMGDTVAHRLDPAAKLLFCMLYLIAAFVADGAFGLGAVSFACLLALAATGAAVRSVRKTLKPFVWLMGFVFLFNALFTVSAQPLFAVGPINVSTGGIAFGAISVLRFALVLLGTSGLMATTSPTELADAVARLLGPLQRLGLNIDGLVLGISLTLRFLPVLSDELDRIMSAQRARGAQFDQRNPLKRAQAFIPVIVPLIASALRRAETLALAIQNREYGANPQVRRTCIRSYRMRTRDGLVVALGAAVLLAAML